MVDIVHTLKHQARILHRRIVAGEAPSLHRLNKQLNPAPAAQDVKRRDCLAILARENGFRTWQHFLHVLEAPYQGDLGTLFYPGRCGAHINIWSADLDEARAIRTKKDGYLLAYKSQYLVVDGDYIETLGLAPDDPDWAAIGRDITDGRDLPARSRLIGRLVRHNLNAA